MSRPFIRWILFAACLVVFLAAMAWVTVRTLRMENERLEEERSAQVQERVRLALWRMDSLAGALVISESARPAWHYQAFSAPRELFARTSRELIPSGEALQPSPLLGEPPEHVLLHFEAGSSVAAHSPQVPIGQELVLTNQWYEMTPPMEAARQRLPQLQAILGRHPDLMQIAQPTITDSPRLWRRPGTSEKEKKQLSQIKAEQEETSNREQSQRLNLLAAQQNVNSGANSLQNSSRQMKVAPLADDLKLLPKTSMEPGMRRLRSEMEERADLGMAATTPAPATAASAAPSKASASGKALADEAPGAAAAEAAAPALMLAETRSPEPERASKDDTSLADKKEEGASAVKLTEMKAAWVEQQLLLVRQASSNGSVRTQGVWVDWPHLQASLIKAVKDLLPEAQLEPSTDSRLDPSHLVALPVRLVPGAVELPILGLDRPLRRTLGIAWVCLILAAVAVGVVLHRALLLSERRAAFVSAVTHELRTPLTTFQLYSEMLAEGMVPEGEKRRHYLNTLCTESTRLTHLVENVLAYSRIERGRTAARRESLSLEDLMQRVEPRLQQRAQQVEMDARVQKPANAAELRLELDPLAVEQILFNLVDNACKYAAPACSRREIEITIEVQPRHLCFHVRDFGPGFSVEQRKRLFQPFAKSATEAAHSAPGVGLGLALCRQLAGELGGELTLKSGSPGAQFDLRLPRMDAKQG